MQSIQFTLANSAISKNNENNMHALPSYKSLNRIGPSSFTVGSPSSEPGREDSQVQCQGLRELRVNWYGDCQTTNCQERTKVRRRPSLRSGMLLLGCAVFVVLGSHNCAMADDGSLPTVLAKRGKLILDDDGSTDRGTKTPVEMSDGIALKTALGLWQRVAPKSSIWRSTWKPGMGHPPVAAYQGIDARNLIVEVTFRYGEATESWHEQFLRIAADQRPQKKGHIVSAWVNPIGHYTEKGFVLEHVGKVGETTGSRGLLLDHQPIKTKAGTWCTATLEIVDDEVLFRMGDHVAYAKAEPIGAPKNLVSLTMGTTWHEIRRVRIWHAEANPEWAEAKDSILKLRKPFTTRPR